MLIVCQEFSRPSAIYFTLGHTSHIVKKPNIRPRTQKGNQTAWLRCKPRRATTPLGLVHNQSIWFPFWVRTATRWLKKFGPPPDLNLQPTGDQPVNTSPSTFAKFFNYATRAFFNNVNISAEFIPLRSHIEATRGGSRGWLRDGYFLFFRM